MLSRQRHRWEKARGMSLVSDYEYPQVISKTQKTPVLSAEMGHLHTFTGVYVIEREASRLERRIYQLPGTGSSGDDPWYS